MKLDEIESVFRSAVKAQFSVAPPRLATGLLITDLDAAASEPILEALLGYLGGIHGESVDWSLLCCNEFENVEDILDRVRRNPPDLVACYRHLLVSGAHLPYSLGPTVDTLTQATDVPVLLLPRPGDGGSIALPETTRRVMVVTDHLVGDSRLANWGVHMCRDDGTLYLAHVEDSLTFARYADAITKIPGLPSETAIPSLRDKLLGMASDYIDHIAGVVKSEGIHENVEPVVTMGHALRDYLRLVDERDVDLLLMNSKDEGQLAMHGLAYALGVEIRDRPLLLL